jgi:DMSO reductase family type II enzyme chaperone
VYRLFSSLFLYPSGDRLATLRAAAEELLHEHGLWPTLDFAESWYGLLNVMARLDEESTATIEEEYVRLFLVNPNAPPYESVYRDPDGHTRGLIAVQLAREYAEAGLALAPSMKEPPDHIAVELEFMSFLCDLEAQKSEANAQEECSRALERQHVFLRQHLGHWFPIFAQRVREAAPEKLYGAVIEVVDAFIGYDLEVLGQS